jgi:ABC-type polar amino acid transport system ATPase subunit
MNKPKIAIIGDSHGGASHIVSALNGLAEVAEGAVGCVLELSASMAGLDGRPFPDKKKSRRRGQRRQESSWIRRRGA